MRGFKRDRQTPYVHIVGTHAHVWNSQLGAMGTYGGEKLENVNNQWKTGLLRQTNFKDMLASILIQIRRQIGMQNQSIRQMQKNAERVPKQGCQGPYRGYQAKEQAKERRDAAEAATAAATASYADPLSSLTVPELLGQYTDVTGQRTLQTIIQPGYIYQFQTFSPGP